MPAQIQRTGEEIYFLGNIYKDLLLETLFQNPELVVTAYNSFKQTMEKLEKQVGQQDNIDTLEILATQGKYGIFEPMKIVKNAAENYEQGKPYDPGSVAASLAIIIRAEMICYN